MTGYKPAGDADKIDASRFESHFVIVAIEILFNINRVLQTINKCDYFLSVLLPKVRPYIPLSCKAVRLVTSYNSP